MQIIISILIIGLLWMIYDLINAPEVDEDENFILPQHDSEEEIEADEKHIEEIELKDKKKTSKVE